MNSLIELRYGVLAGLLAIGCFSEPPPAEESSSTSGTEDATTSQVTGSTGGDSQSASTSMQGSSVSTEDPSADAVSSAASTSPSGTGSTGGVDTLIEGYFANLAEECGGMGWVFGDSDLECDDPPAPMVAPSVFRDLEFPMQTGPNQAIVVKLPPGNEPMLARFALTEIGIPEGGFGVVDLAVFCGGAGCSATLANNLTPDSIPITDIQFSSSLNLGEISTADTIELSIINNTNAETDVVLFNPALYTDL